ncbi:MAG TPA: SH3 domain-containing protein [Candidatus Angelobacter sp.]|nr:SH3 domain-containing protein [Candidatus Angelobacter sp.]
MAAIFVLLTGCTGGASGKNEYVYVAVADASLRDRVATVYNKTGTVHNGEKLVVLDRMQNKRFVRVRAPHGEEGWLQERYLADQGTFDQFQRLAEQFKSTPAQGTAMIEQQVKVHVLPGRKTGFMYMLDEKQKVTLLERRPVDRNAPVASAARDDRPKDSDDSSDDETPGNNQPSIWEDWWLVRDAQQRIGWVLGRALYLDVPDQVAQYAEGQRIVAAFPLDDVEDQGKKVSEYLVLLTEPKDGMPYDYNQIRVFTWNMRKHRYETAYRERNLAGTLPVALGSQEFEKEGTLRTFTLHLKDKDGSLREQMYKFRPPMVHKVYAAGQEPPGKTRAKATSSRSTT